MKKRIITILEAIFLVLGTILLPVKEAAASNSNIQLQEVKEKDYLYASDIFMATAIFYQYICVR